MYIVTMLYRRKKSYWFLIAASVFLTLVVVSLVLISVNSKSLYDSSNRLFCGEKYFYFNHQLILRDPLIKDNPYNKDLFRISDGRLYYDEANVQTWFGIDVSEFQDWIRWSRVKDDGVEFVFARIGYRGYSGGIMHKDSTFEYNYSEIHRNGIPMGIYFFSQAVNDEEAVEEAEYVLSMLGGRALELPIVFDWEYVSESAMTGGITPDALSSACNAFCDRIEEAGYSSMVYTNLYGAYSKYNFSEISDRDIWLAEYDGSPTFRYHFEVLQYTSSGSIHGIDGSVDLNLMFIDPRSYLTRTGSVPS